MNRGTIIATVVAGSGVLIAGTVASIAVINAASSTPAQSQTVQLVDQTTALPASDPAPQEIGTPAALEPLATASALPELPSDSPAADATQTPTPTPTPTPTKKRKPAAATTRPNSRPAAVSVSAAQAARIVLDKGTGVATTSVAKERHQGLQTWAVQITRANGEVLTGFVDQASGVVIDWRLDRPATTPSPQGTTATDDSGGGSNGSDDQSSSDDHGHGGDNDSDD